MRLYVTPKGRWAGTQADAKELAREDGGWEQFEVPTDKDGLLTFLNVYHVDAMHGEAKAMIAASKPAEPYASEAVKVNGGYPAFPAPTYSQQSIAIDEAWEALPLGRKLHFAAMAMEDARELLPSA